LKEAEMPEITAALVKDLREKTGAGMMDCKRALSETAGDVEGAVDWLRKKGLSAAAKKAGRVAAEGLVGVETQGRVGAVVEVNSDGRHQGRRGAWRRCLGAQSGRVAGWRHGRVAVDAAGRDHRREYEPAPGAPAGSAERDRYRLCP
jgi:hypothetical protein